MKNSIIYTAAFLLSVFAASAKEEVYWSSPKYLWQNQVNTTVFIHDNVFFEGSSLRTTPLAGQVTLNTVFTLSMFLNLENYVGVFGQDFRVEAKVQCQFFNRNNLPIETQTRDLRIYYSTGTNINRREDEFRLERKDIAKVAIRILSITVTNTTDINLPLPDFSNFIRIKPQLKIERYYQPVINEFPVAIGDPLGNAGQRFYIDWIAATNEVGFYCYPNQWAEQIEIEWCYLDNYTLDLSQEQSILNFNFKNNSTRIALDSLDGRVEYKIPIIYDRGVLLFRTRAIGKWHSGDPAKPSRVEGAWSLPDRVSLNVNSPGTDYSKSWMKIEPYHNNQKMWQRMATFAENGKHKQVISHLDGSLRDRASFVNLSTDKLWVLSQKLYDHQGRPTVQVLPFPLIASTLEFPGQNNPSRLQSDNLNRLNANTLYNRDNFDRDLNACNLQLDPLSNLFGAGRYYSALNTDTTGYQAFTPDAEGYPFMQVEYTPDNTGRIRRQGAPGKNHQLGSGHEQVYYYSVPSQDELDIVFGNDAGYAQHYKKTAMLDANRQMYVTYTDIDGKTVATALAGNAPDNLESIERPTPKNITINLFEQANRVDVDGMSLVADQNIIIASATDLQIHYQLSPQSYFDQSCTSLPQGFCFDCVYDLALQLRDDCGQVFYSVDRKIGNLRDTSQCEAFSFVLDTTLRLGPGQYFISKRLTVNTRDADTYADYYINNNPCLREIEVIKKDSVIAGLNPGNCDAPCVECPEETIASDYQLADGTTISIPMEIQAQFSGICAPACPDSLPSPCMTARLAMLNDMSPGGQYAKYSRSSTGQIVSDESLSILNDGNILPLKNTERKGSWRQPITPYRNPDGSRAYIELPKNVPGSAPRYMEEAGNGNIDLGNGIVRVKPENLNSIEDFILHWRPSWAKSLLPYHPEFNYLQWCYQNEDIRRNDNDAFAYERMLLSSKTYAEAQQNGFGQIFDPADSLAAIANDPFFVSHPAAVEMMQDSLSQFICKQEGAACRTYYNITEAVYLLCHCNNPNDSPEDRIACMTGARLFAGNARSDEKEWTFYSTFYRAKRRAVMDIVRQQEVQSDRPQFDNRQVGNRNSISPYREKTRIFNDAKDAEKHLRTDASGIEGYAANYSDFIVFSQNWRKRNCNVCPIGSDLEALLNAFASEKRLTERGVKLDGEVPLVLTKRLTERFSPANQEAYYWFPNTSGNQLDISIHTGASSGSSRACRIILENTETNRPIDWTAIDWFLCLEPDPQPDRSDRFTIKAYFKANNRTVTLRGTISCAKLNDCNDLGSYCQRNEAGDLMLALMGYVFNEKRFAQSHVLEDKAFEVIPGLGVYYFDPYKYKRYDRGFFGFIHIGPDRKKEDTCRLVFVMMDLTKTFEDIVRIVDLKKIPVEVNKDSLCYSLRNFILVAEDDQGKQFEIGVGWNCDPLFNCCLFGPDFEKEPGFCCFTPSPRIPYFNNCFELDQAIAEQDIKRETERRETLIRESIRTAYIRRCLQAAEQFTIQYADPIYHYTLFYYDQAGNLLKTVPPKGVDLLTDTEMQAARQHRSDPARPRVAPDHRMATTYTYNTLNQVTAKRTPDDGETRYTYDELGRIILSQNAEQIAASQTIYNLYDPIGRTIESGRIDEYTIGASKIPYNTLVNYIYPLRAKTSVYRTIYDRSIAPAISGLLEGGQQNLRNRVATVLYQETYDSNSQAFDHATHFSYDILGNVKELVQDFPALRSKYHAAVPLEQTRKKVQYQYDLVSGNVSRVHYQPGQSDQFIHWYHYDADNRLVQVKTGTSLHEDDEIRDIDAHYYYYKHGPLARTVLGKEKVQGIDYAYTLQGWLKGINAGTLDPNRDMGRDGALNSPNRNVAKDVFGFNLGYFDGDYQPIHTGKRAEAVRFTPSTAQSPLQGNGLYNGNIRFTTSAIAGLANNPIQAYQYRYDQLNRLTDMQVYRQPTVNTANTWQGGSLVEDYRMQLRYDANGNITRLMRKTEGGTLMDDLRYYYPDSLNNNRLGYITDPVAAALSPLDLDNQSPNNYRYDLIGRNTRDAASGVTNIQWNTLDRVDQVIREDGAIIKYAYDAFGRRALKRVLNPDGTVNGTYYVNDAKGAILALYDITEQSNTAALPASTAFRHVTNASNTRAYFTTLDHPALNGNANALIFIMPNYNMNGAEAAGVNYLENAGVWYDGARWTIFNQDTTKAMPLSMTFNVLIAPANHPNCFTYTCTDASKAGWAANTMAIDHPALNGKPNVSLLITQNHLAAYNNNSQVVGYGNPGRWFISNNKYLSPNPDVSQQSTMPVGARFNIMVIENGAVPGFPEAESFLHTANAENIIPAGQNSTFLDRPSVNNNTNAMVWATPNWGWSPASSAEQTTGPYNDSPVKIWYDHPGDSWNSKNGFWAIYNSDGTPMRPSAKFNVVTMDVPAFRPYAAFVHTAIASNISGSETVLDNAALNNNPDLILQITADYRTVYNAASTGVRYDGARWRIYNIDGSPMPVNIRYNVMVERRGANHFVHTATTSNTGVPGAYVTKLDHPALNNNPAAVLLVTQIPGAEGRINTSEIAVWYTGDGRWNIYNENASAMPDGAAFYVSILPATANAGVHVSAATNIWGQVPSATETTFTDSGKLMFLTHNGTQGAWNPAPCGVYYPPGRSAWSILTGNLAPMTERRGFNVVPMNAVAPPPPLATTTTMQWTQSPIYGAARLGMYQPRSNAITGLAATAPLKAYELSDHIGNVLSVVTDRKLPDGTGGWKAWTTLSQDYYPFGMEMPGREGETAGLPKYPFAYQGMEQDNAPKGEGNAYTTEYRQYDARVGRWLSVDAMANKYPNFSPYVGMGDNPIVFTDNSGLDISVTQEEYQRLWDESARTISESMNVDPAGLAEIVGSQLTAQYGNIEITSSDSDIASELQSTADIGELLAESPSRVETAEAERTRQSITAEVERRTAPREARRLSPYQDRDGRPVQSRGRRRELQRLQSGREGLEARLRRESLSPSTRATRISTLFGHTGNALVAINVIILFGEGETGEACYSAVEWVVGEGIDWIVRSPVSFIALTPNTAGDGVCGRYNISGTAFCTPEIIRALQDFERHQSIDWFLRGLSQSGDRPGRPEFYRP